MESVEEFIENIANNRHYKSMLRKALELDDNYAMKSDLVPILERLEEQGKEIQILGEEMKAQREEMRSGFEKVWDEMKAQREEMKAQREEMKAQREEMRSGFEKVWDEMAKQREEMRSGFEKVWDEIAKQREEMKAQREEMRSGFEKVWDEMKGLRLDVNKVHNRMDKHEKWLKKIGGDDLELMSKLWLTGVLEAKQLPHENLVWKRKFSDKKARLGTEDIEIDIFSDDPLLAVEVTSFFSELAKLTKFLKKLEFLEEEYGRKPIAVIITYGFDESIEEVAIELIESKKIHLITIGRKFDWDDDP